ncbi:MAG: serine/threonine protein kinase [Myxococcales bacterium]|nr:serine/threonine protein kinase [Myxococcales bacterium]MCB9732082.1 serine/threonine protein kinase [Deltaproteobacteria bacterium]
MSQQQAERYLGTRTESGWTLVRLVGAGKFAWVYEAHDDGKAHRAAVKVLYRRDTQGERRFHREIKVMRELPRHPNVVGYLAHGSLGDGTPYVALEYVDGFTLQSVLQSGRRLPERTACTLMSQVCEGFRELHKLGLTHRDITPDNIMVTHQGRQVKIMDFGLVQDSQGILKLFEERDVLAGHDFADNLDKGLIAGTPEYMAPEQITDPQSKDRERQETDTTADVFALSCLFYQLLNGEQLFPWAVGSGGASGKQGLVNYLRYRQAWTDADLRCPEWLDAELWSILRKGLARDPKQRQRTAQELGDDVRFYLETGQGVLEDDLSETLSQPVDPERLRSLIMTTGDFQNIRSLAGHAPEAETIPDPMPPPVLPVLTVPPTTRKKTRPDPAPAGLLAQTTPALTRSRPADEATTVERPGPPNLAQLVAARARPPQVLNDGRMSPAVFWLITLAIVAAAVLVAVFLTST